MPLLGDVTDSRTDRVGEAESRSGWVPECGPWPATAAGAGQSAGFRHEPAARRGPRSWLAWAVAVVLVGAGGLLVAGRWHPPVVAAPLPTAVVDGGRGAVEVAGDGAGEGAHQADVTVNAAPGDTAVTSPPADGQPTGPSWDAESPARSIPAATPETSATSGGRSDGGSGNVGGAGGPRPQFPTEPWRDDTLVIPAVGISASIGAATVTGTVLNPPPDVATVGLWSGSAAIDSASGTMLVTGHVDTVGQGRGALWSLHRARPGDQVFTMLHSRLIRWTVTGVTAVPKDQLPQGLFAGEQGPRRLVLVTCGGALMRDSVGRGSYADNVIVTAKPTPS